LTAVDAFDSRAFNCGVDTLGKNEDCVLEVSSSFGGLVAMEKGGVGTGGSASAGLALPSSMSSGAGLKVGRSGDRGGICRFETDFEGDSCGKTD